jgi:tetratricopeptide (TPR) repeat protein
MSPARSALFVCALAVPGALAAQVPNTPPSGFDLERGGRIDAAARAYQDALTSSPGRIADLLGLERVLIRLDRLDEVMPFVARAIEAAPGQEVAREIAFRVAGTLFGADSAYAAASRWSDAFPDSRNPYRVHARWLVARGDVAVALGVLDAGEARTGRSMDEFRAHALVTAGDWPAAARAWRRAVRGNAGFASPAAANLGAAPTEVRAAVLEALGSDRNAAASELRAEVLVRWGRVEEAWVALDAGLPGERGAAAGMLRRFAERLARMNTREAGRARGLALERLAERVGDDEAAALRLEAAQVYAGAGYPDAARRVLDRRASGARSQDAEAAATLIRVMIAAGRLDEAEAQYRERRDRIGPDDRGLLRAALAWARLRSGDLDRAERVLEADSSVASLGVRGWIAAYRGELEDARDLLTAAGPAAATRGDASRRAGFLVLLERVEARRSPALGAALFTLERGDSVAAADRLSAAARALRARAGRADVLVLAADVAMATARPADAERWYREALDAEPDGPTAPHAEYALAVMLHERGRPVEARAQLEHLIIAHGSSAVVPKARRLLDTVRGVVP